MQVFRFFAKNNLKTFSPHPNKIAPVIFTVNLVLQAVLQAALNQEKRAHSPR